MYKLIRLQLLTVGLTLLNIALFSCEIIETRIPDARPTRPEIAPKVEYSDQVGSDETESDGEPGARLAATGPKGKIYLQYTRLDDKRELEGVFLLTDYCWQNGVVPSDADWRMSGNLANYVDTVRLAALVASKAVKKTIIKHKGIAPVKLRTLYAGFHVLTDRGPNPRTFTVTENQDPRPLIWFNSNYPQSPQSAVIRLKLKGYPEGYNLKWAFFGEDYLGSSTAAQFLSYIQSDNDLADFYGAFSGMTTTKSRSLRAPHGKGIIIIKTNAGTYQGVVIEIGVKKSVTLTFTAVPSA